MDKLKNWHKVTRVLLVLYILAIVGVAGTVFYEWLINNTPHYELFSWWMAVLILPIFLFSMAPEEDN